MTTKKKTHTPAVTASRTLFMALAACCGLAHFTESAQAEDPQPRQILVRVDSDLLVPLIERLIEEVQDVDEVILGVRSIGQARVTGQPKMTLADDPDSAAFSVTITGTINSRTTGSNGPVQIYSRSTTQFTATKRVVFQPGRGFVGEAAEIVAKTSSQPERIVPNRRRILGRAIERRARNRVAESREQVNQEVREKAEAKIREALDQLLEQRLARVNRLAEHRHLLAAVLGGPRYDCWTSRGWLNIAVSSADDSSSDAPPARETMLDQFGTLGQDGPPIQVWVHQRVLGEPLSLLLRWVHQARHVLGRWIVSSPAAADSTVALLSQSSFESSYDFAAIGDWFVVHAGRWNQGKLAVARGAALGDGQ